MKPLKTFLCVICVIIFLTKTAFAATFLEVGHPLYDSLLFLEAAGCLKSALLNTLPLSRREILRLLEEAETCSSSNFSMIFRTYLLRLRSLGEFDPLVSYFRPLDEMKTGILVGDFSAPLKERIHNRDGFKARDGLNFWVQTVLRAEGKSFSLLFSPTWEYTGRGQRLFLSQGYLVFTKDKLSFLTGRISQWWGPVRNGALLLSNNAYPLDLFLVTNEHPFLWRGDLFRFVFFVTRLEKRRAVPHPYLWGLRLDWKPLPCFEMGISRTAFLGGKDYGPSKKTWFKSFLGMGGRITKEPIDQLVAFDIKITSKVSRIPFQLYGEFGREDLAGNLWKRWAWSGGIYFPLLLPNGYLSWRMEYTRTPEDWGKHHLYRNGYTYKGQGIGHYLTRNGRAIFTSLVYQLPFWQSEVSLNGEEAKGSFLGKEKKISLKIRRLGWQGILGLEIGYLKVWEKEDTRGSPFLEVSFSLRW